MAENVIGSIPEFTSDDTPAGNAGLEEVKEVSGDEPEVSENETPSEPPAEEETQPEMAKDSGDKARVGLARDIALLRQEISALKGQRREIRQENIIVAKQELDILKDVNPQDAELIEKVLRAKGYVNKSEAQQMYVKSVEDQALHTFWDKFPEYKEENDPLGTNWNALMSWYKKPGEPHQTYTQLERAHRAVVSVDKLPTDRAIPAKKQQVALASVGSGGAQRSSSISSSKLSSKQRMIYEQGGWSDEEIAELEAKL